MIRKFLAIIALLLAPAIAHADYASSGLPLSGGTVTGAINLTNGATIQQNGINILNVANGNFVLPNIPQCSGNCDTLIGPLAGSMLPSVDFLTTAVGFHACGSMTDLRTESVCYGYNAGGLITGIVGANGHWINAFGINTIGNCTTACNNILAIATDAMRDVVAADHDVYAGDFAGEDANCSDSAIVGESGGSWNGSATGCIGLAGIGRNVLQCLNATTAHDLDGLGDQVLTNCTSAFNGVASGSFAGNAVTTDSNFVLSGYHAGWRMAGTANNTITGSTAGSGVLIGNGNSIYGAAGGLALTSGNNDTLIAFNACKFLTTGSADICLGINTGTNLVSASNVLLIGSSVDDATNASNYINIWNTWSAILTNTPAASVTTIAGYEVIGGAGLPVASLTTCNAGRIGQHSFVTDATAPVYNTTVTGGGTVSAPVFCNGLTWVTASNDNLKSPTDHANDDFDRIHAVG